MPDVRPSMLDEALQYAKHGWHVFPLHTPRPYGCSCRVSTCENIGKHPRTKHGVSDATTDPERITTWWGMWPDANVGLACGPSGLVVIDVDPRHGGDESLADLKKKWGRETFLTVSSHTGGGGEHYFFAQPSGVPISNVSSSPKFTGPLGPGIDVRAMGGYVVAPPSIHASGELYEWYEGESPFERTPQRLPLPLIEALETRTTERKDSAPVSAAAILAGVPEGGRDHSLFQLASKLRYADVPIDWAYQLVEAAADACIPPFDRKLARLKVSWAYKKYEAGQGAFVSPEEAEDALTHAEGLQGRVDLLPHILGTMPPPEWLIDGILLRGHVHMFHGEPGCGKTNIALYVVIETLRKGLPVLFVDEESGPQMIGDRLRLMGLEQEHVANLHYFPFAGITVDDSGPFLQYVAETQPALVLWDSMADVLTTSHLDEGDAADVTRWLTASAIPAARLHNAACLILDHETKDQGNTRYSRGSGAKKAKMDIAYHVEKTVDFDQTRVGRVTLSNTKNRVGIAEPKAVFAVGGENGMLIAERYKPGAADATTLSDRERETLAIVRNSAPDGVGNAELQAALGVGKTHVTTLAKSLMEKGLISQTGAGRSTKYLPEESTSGRLETDSGRFPEESYSATRGDPPYVVGGPPLADYAQGGRIGKNPQETKRHWWEEKQEDDEW